MQRRRAVPLRVEVQPAEGALGEIGERERAAVKARPALAVGPNGCRQVASAATARA
jgi:hypothetical protein